jgi:apolipoprotein N-acyltransferase
VQANIPQNKKWDPKHAQTILREYSALTTRASKNEPKPDLIVWPESATPWAITQVPTLYSKIRKLTRETGALLFLGSTSHVKFRKTNDTIVYQNSAFLIDPHAAGRPPRYDKIVLFPFGEYIPLKEYVPWNKIGIPDIGSYQKGENYTVFKGPGYQFSATICWENGFPGLVRKLVQNGAQFIVNVTNEAWFGPTAAPYQFLTYNIFRAAEHRRYVVRCTNTGVSCFIDPYGRIVDRVMDENGRTLFVQGTASHAVTPIDTKTIYTRFGDWPVWVSIGVCLVFIVLALADMIVFGFRRTRE